MSAEDSKTFQLAKVILGGAKGPGRFERRMENDPSFSRIVEATRVPDADGELAEIKDPFLRAKVADALDLSSVVKNAPGLFDLATALAQMGYHASSDKVRKQAEYIRRTYPNGPW